LASIGVATNVATSASWKSRVGAAIATVLTGTGTTMCCVESLPHAIALVITTRITQVVRILRLAIRRWVTCKGELRDRDLTRRIDRGKRLIRIGEGAARDNRCLRAALTP
jgi:hypothetical protein